MLRRSAFALRMARTGVLVISRHKIRVDKMRDKFKQPYKENGNLYNSHYALQRGKLWDGGILWRGSTLKALARGSDSAFAEKPPPEHAIDIRLNKQNGLND